jgi:hypothetical protein
MLNGRAIAVEILKTLLAVKNPDSGFKIETKAPTEA